MKSERRAHSYVSVYIEVMYALLVFICYRFWSNDPEMESEDFKYEMYRMYVILMGEKGCTLSQPD